MVTNEDLKTDLRRGIEAVTSMVAEEISHVTKNQHLHQEKDNMMFGRLENSMNIITTEIRTLNNNIEEHNKLISKGKGAMWGISVLAGLGAVIDLFLRVFHSK